MNIGICEIELFIYETNSLKEKRQVIKSILERIKSRYNVSIAEVGFQDLWQRSLIGFSCVSNSKRQVNSVIDKVINFILEDSRVEIVNKNLELL